MEFTRSASRGVEQDQKDLIETYAAAAVAQANLERVQASAVYNSADARSEDNPFLNNESFQERYGLANHDQARAWTIRKKASG